MIHIISHHEDGVNNYGLLRIHHIPLHVPISVCIVLVSCYLISNSRTQIPESHIIFKESAKCLTRVSDPSDT